MAQLREVVHQRWPDFEDGQQHDVVFTLGGRPVWICFERRRAVPTDAAEQWYLELRPIERGEMLPVGVLEDDRIAQAVGHMHDQFNRSPSLNTVADLVGISPFHFHRLFSKQVGMTPKQYVLLKQIQMAKWMLRSRRMPISRIATQTGFASHGHFTSTFRRMQGQSPTEYREQVED
jgi:AraC-like DNA-binding protein